MKEANHVISLFEEAAGKYGDQPFLISEERTFSFLDIDRLSNRLSDGLHQLGVRPGDHVAFCLEGSTELVVSRFAVQKLDAVVIPINNRLISPEIEYILRNSEADWAVVHSSFVPQFQQITIPGLMERVIVVGEKPAGTKAVSYEDLIAKGSPRFSFGTRDPESTAMIIYTSGTTGYPKGAVIRHFNSVEAGRYTRHNCRMVHGDILLSSTPMYNSSSLDGYFLAASMTGVPWVLTRRFSPKEVLDKLEGCKVTIYHAAGSLLAMVMTHESFPKRNLSSLRMVNWSNVLPMAYVEQLIKALPSIDMVHLYGSTETSVVGTYITLKERLARPESCGKANPEFSSIRVVDEQGRDLPAGEIGEIIHRSRGVMREYYNNPLETRKAIRNGWLYTGDLGKLDEEGYLYIAGRVKEMINRGGEKVYAPEVEKILYEHPAVQEVAVVGVVHEMLGEEVKAFVVLRNGLEITEEELIAHCRGRLAHFKIPKTIEFRSKLPKNSMGKIQKHELVPGK